MSNHSRLHRLFSQVDTEEPALSIIASKAKYYRSKKTPELDFGGNDFNDGDNWDDDDDDDDDDWDDDDENDEEDDQYLAEKLELAEDEDAVLTDARIIFQRDPKTNKVYMVARLDDIELPEDFSPHGDEMHEAEIILKVLTSPYLDPDTSIAPIDAKVFKKKNWNSRGR